MTYYAFFDVDGTLLNGTSMLDFLRFYYQERFAQKPRLANIYYQMYLIRAWILKKLFQSRELLNSHYYRSFKNQDTQWIKNLGQKWFTTHIKNNPHAYKANVVAELKHHQRQGAEIVLVSGSFAACLEPLAADLSVSTILCTQMMRIKNIYSGQIMFPMIGEGKTKAIRRFLKQKKFAALARCYAYGDHFSDLSMLKLVGNPRVVSGDACLESWAKMKNVPVFK